MYLNFVKQYALPICVCLFMASCNKSEDEPPVQPIDDTTTVAPTPYTLTRPLGFPYPFLSQSNPLTEEGIALGSRFYSDPILSSNGLSCSSCHHKALSYSTTIFNTKEGYRISVPPHVNLAFKKYYNWEGSVVNLDTLCMVDFEPDFFNMDSALLFKRLNAHPTYPNMIKKAFRVSNINSLTYHQLKLYICYSISQYMRTLVSANSRFDSIRLRFVQPTIDEAIGMNIFFSEKGDCFHCHSNPLFTDNDFHNNGLNDVYTGFDKGRAIVTSQDKDLGKFFTPTLRNIALTAPYMHDGRFNTLEEVIEFYNSGVKITPYSDPLMNKQGNMHQLNLTEQEKQSLVAFLKTLTDKSFVE